MKIMDNEKIDQMVIGCAGVTKYAEQKTVPMITTYGFNIGGYEALTNYLEEVSGGYGH